ncbi:hypothetical protein M5689_020807 [Euphorbia peplus]|nr:hypothetical protein M5689_020807 [Euphorbia peplus]
MAQEQNEQVTVTRLFESKVTLNPSKVFPSKFLDEQCLTTLPISKWLSTQNLISFASLDEVIYPVLVTEFYKNCFHRSDELDVIHSVVRRVDVEVSKTSLASILGTADEGVIIREDGSVEGFDDSNWGRHDLTAKETYATWLSQHQRWAHYLTTNVFLPKSEGVNCVSNWERVFMYHFINEKKINLSAMILRQMKGLKPNGTLAYGSLLTGVFESVSVDFPADAIRSRSTPITFGPLSKLVFG